jgi:dienelactone hydrolase
VVERRHITLPFGPFENFAGKLPAFLSAASDALRPVDGRRASSYIAEPVPYGDSAEQSSGTAFRPAPAASVGLATKVAFDEAFRSLMVALSQAPNKAEVCLVKHELAEAGAMFEDRGWLADPTSYHHLPPELTSPIVRPDQSWGMDFEHMQFVSGYEPHAKEAGRERWLGYKPTRTAHAWVLRHRDRPRPWLVCVHGYRMGFPVADFHAFRARWLHRELGLNVIFPVLPLHGPRKVGRRSGDGFFSIRFMDMVHAEAQAIWDLRRILDWIRGQGVEDVGVYGVSLGGYTAALLSGFDPDLRCVVAGMPTVCLATLLQEHAPRRMLALAEQAELGWESALRVLRVVSPLAVKPRVPRANRFIYAGAADRVVPQDHITRLWSHWEEPVLRWFEGSHLSFTWERAINDLVYEMLATSGMLAPHSVLALTRKRAA